VKDDADNPFLADFYSGRGGAAFQAQLFYTLGRQRRLQQLRQGDLFSQTTICDFVFERCITERPPLADFAPGRSKTCHLKGFGKDGKVIA
jgi:deoxyadenosine/deoxycytidine kinase